MDVGRRVAAAIAAGWRLQCHSTRDRGTPARTSVTRRLAVSVVAATVLVSGFAMTDAGAHESANTYVDITFVCKASQEGPVVVDGEVTGASFTSGRYIFRLRNQSTVDAEEVKVKVGPVRYFGPADLDAGATTYFTTDVSVSNISVEADPDNAFHGSASAAETPCTYPPDSTFVRVTFLCKATSDGPILLADELSSESYSVGDYVFRLRNESDADAAEVTAGVGGAGLFGPADIGAGDTTYFATTSPVAGVSAQSDPENDYTGTASTNEDQPCTYPPPAGTAVALQAVPQGLQTLVAAWASGPADGSGSIQLLTATTCPDGVLGEDQAVLATIPVTFDPDGLVFFYDTVVDQVSLQTYVAARLGDGELSACIVAGPDNDAWTRALEIPLTGSGSVRSGASTGFVDAPGRARWYKFAIQPGAKTTVELTGLPADYDLAVFTDITQAFSELVGDQDVDGLNRLGAEFAPSVFSPSTFSPSAFSPSTFSPSAFSPSAFSPSTFSPSVFSPSTFSPSTFSPSAFSPSTFSPSTFSPSTFSPSTFSPSTFSPSTFSPSTFSADNYASAQTRSLIAVSAGIGTGDELVVADTWSNTGYFYIRVNGKNGAFDLTDGFDVSASVDGELCAGVTPSALSSPAPTAGGYHTVILWDPGRMDPSLPGNGPADMTVLEQQLHALADRPEVDGVIVDLGVDPRVGALQAQADATPSCPYAENLTAHAIKDVIDGYRSLNPDLAYVTLVGGDDQIPFFRYPDQALLGPEQDYDPPVAEGTQANSALRLNYVLGQDEYGARRSISVGDSPFPIPDLAVGRLVEHASEISTLLAAYLDTTEGVVDDPTSSLVTGYDFLADVAGAVQSELVAGTGPGARNDTLITPGDVSPNDPQSWTADDLRRELLGDPQGEDLIFLAGHFSANSALAADYQTTIITTELAASDVDLTNSIVFSAGCHSGYNIVDAAAVPGVTLPLDWTQAFAQKGATLIAGTGYQYGDTDFIEYSERLYQDFAEQLRTGTGPVSVGQALVAAKQQYLADTPDLRGLHRKSVLISTVFGLPMLRIDMPGERIVPPPDTTPIVPTLVSTGPGTQLGLQQSDLHLDFLGADGPLTPHTVDLTNVDDETHPVRRVPRGPERRGQQPRRAGHPARHQGRLRRGAVVARRRLPPGDLERTGRGAVDRSADHRAARRAHVLLLAGQLPDASWRRPTTTGRSAGRRGPSCT